MKKIFLAIVACLAVTTTPTTSAVSMGTTVAYKIAAGCVGIKFTAGALQLSLISAMCVLKAREPQPTFHYSDKYKITSPYIGAIVSGSLALGCFYLGYRCFKEMLSPFYLR